MEKTLISLFVIGLAISAVESNPFEIKNVEEIYENKEPTTTVPPTTSGKPFTCTTEGTFCKGCNTLVACYEGEDGFDEVELQICDAANGEYCYKDRECRKTFVPECISDYKFDCTAQAIFPDPVNCNQYHICVHKFGTYYSDLADNIVWEDHVLNCKQNYTYNMVTTYCDIKRNNSTCPDTPPVPICTKLGQSGPLLNKSIWYICKKTTTSQALYPELHLCPYGKVFNNGRCEEKKL